MFFHRLTVGEKQYLLNRDNLTQPIQIELSQKQKTFSRFFFFIFKTYIKFSTFEKKKMTLIAHIFPEIPAPKPMVIKMSKKLFFREPVERQQ